MTRPPIVVRRPITSPARLVAAQAERSGFTPKQKPNPLELAQFWLGNRLQERPAGYFLDGTYADLTRIMRETNRLLALHGRDQVISNESWRVD